MTGLLRKFKTKVRLFKFSLKKTIVLTVIILTKNITEDFKIENEFIFLLKKIKFLI